MSVPAIVKKDFRDGIRSKLLWALMGMFLLLLGGFAALVARDAPDAAPEGTDILNVLGLPALLALLLLVPVTALVVSVKSIVKERELGSIKILVSLPHSRSDVVLGKFIGRAGLLTASILAGFVPAGLLLLFTIDGLSIYAYSVFVFVTILFGIAFLAVGIGVSALMDTETRATVAGIAVFFLLYLWTWVLSFVNDRIELLDGNALLFVERFHLLMVFSDMVRALLSLREDLPTNASGVVGPEEGNLAIQDGAIAIADQPFYLQHWFAFVILAIWIAAPIAIGYYRFETTDL